jgi:hypothetical protein
VSLDVIFVSRMHHPAGLVVDGTRLSPGCREGCCVMALANGVCVVEGSGVCETGAMRVIRICDSTELRRKKRSQMSRGLQLQVSSSSKLEVKAERPRRK